MKRTTKRRLVIGICLIFPAIHFVKWLVGGTNNFGIFIVLCEVLLALIVGYTCYPKRRDDDDDEGHYYY